MLPVAFIFSPFLGTLSWAPCLLCRSRCVGFPVDSRKAVWTDVLILSGDCLTIQEKESRGQIDGPIDPNGYDVTESGTNGYRALGQPGSE